nr:AP-1 complex subunit gamma-1-like [Aedes albopictus]
MVNRYCGNIHGTFAEEDSVCRCRNRGRNITELLHPENFGELECLELTASLQFTDKRIDYLGRCCCRQTARRRPADHKLYEKHNGLTKFVVDLALSWELEMTCDLAEKHAIAQCLH